MTEPNEPYNTESHAQGMFSTSEIPGSLKGSPSWLTRVICDGHGDYLGVLYFSYPTDI